MVPSHSSFAKGQRATRQVASSERAREGPEGAPPRPKPQFCDPVSGVGFPGGSVIKNPPAKGDAVDGSSIPGSGRSPAGGNEMATHSSTLVWKIPRTGKPGGPQSVRSQKIWKQLSMHAVSEVAPRHICLFCPQEANYLVQFMLRADYKVRTPGAGPPLLGPARLMGRGEGLGKGTHPFPSLHLAST